MAKSATASVDAAALDIISLICSMLKRSSKPVAVHNTYRISMSMRSYWSSSDDILLLPRAAKRSTSAQSNPAPAEANILQEGGIKGTSSLSHLPISPPVFQNGLKMAENSPHLFSFRAFRNSSRCLSFNEGRTTVKSFENSVKKSVFHLTGSPMWSTIGLLETAEAAIARFERRIKVYSDQDEKRI